MKKIIVFFIYLTMGINILFAQDIENNIKERLYRNCQNQHPKTE